MIRLHDLRYVRIAASDLDQSVQFATRILGLELVERDGARAWLRGDDRDHNVCYVKGAPPQQSIGFQLASDDEIESAAAALDQAGCEPTLGSAAEADERRVGRLLRFADPSGNRIELVARPAHSGVRYFPSRDAGIAEFSHIGLRTTDPVRDEAFWTRTCNARVSDWIGDAALLRIDQVHHKIALFPSAHPGLQHVNFQVASTDDVMRSWYFLTSQQVKIVFGPGRHPTSGAVFLYFLGPDDIVYEYSCGVRRIDDEAGYVPRRFPRKASSFCMWGSVPDIAEFRADGRTG